ncbi:MAG: hypothetical protein R6U41_04445 [Desulfosalsimonas sp.]|uniref:hypothetical protein n=1 Tax=Desulfosalsimonas sp. TaxID=3073848 RepID=UPI00397110D7
MSKSVWISMIKKDEAAAQAVYKMVSGYGLGVSGHFWKDDPENMQWAGAVSEIAAKTNGLWLIAGDAGDFTPSVLRDLSLLALSVQAQKAAQLPVMILTDDPEGLGEKLTTPLAGAQVFSPDNPALGAKITAKANLPLKPLAAQYRLNVHAMPKIGLWIEAGPAEDTWSGVIVGAGGNGAAIDAMGIGPAGQIPEKSVLEYPVRDMTLALGDREFSAWAAQNHVSETESVYVRIKGQPGALLFGPFAPNADELDVYTLTLE